jgi:transposase-like protein
MLRERLISIPIEKTRKRDYDEVKAGAQAIYLAEGRAQAEAAFRAFRSRWCRAYPAMVRRLQQDLPELLSFFAFPDACGTSCALPT